MGIDIGKMYSHIKKSSEKLLKKTIRIKSKSNHLIKSKCCQKYCYHYKTMKTYCLSCKKTY